MDIDRARTFLEIIRRGSFLHAAERLHVTQTTVSARIRTLEDELGRKLFVRNRNGAHLTAAGREFERFALSFVQIWERARQKLAIPPGHTGVISLGCEPNLCNPLLLDWIVGMKRQNPQIAVRADTAPGAQLLDMLKLGALDIAVLCAPALSQELRALLLHEERLLLVRRSKGCPDGGDPDVGESDAGVQGAADHHVRVDWGQQFSLPAVADTLGEPDLVVGSGALGLAYILREGGHGYFRAAEVKAHVEAGDLEIVEDAPRFTVPVYAVHAEAGEERTELRAALEELKSLAASMGG